MKEQELKKCKADIALCSKIFRLGECLNTSCQLRHILKQSDQRLPCLPTKSIVNFELVSVTSPTSFVIKILTHFSHEKLVSWNDKHRDTENSLNNDLQKVQFQEAQALSIGKLYAIQSSGKWHRCRVIAKP